ncbi:MAG TPA: hypothetical protein VJY39_10225 [Acidisphaera sp.]|nr:hypothetical protein [Acidisphaera sp.]
MIQLVLIFCLAGDPHSCKEVRPVVEDINSPMACMTMGQIVAANEINSSLGLQGYVLSKWRCEIGKRAERAL